jgi:nucleotide-binding universal stress UspA family protein
MTMTKNGLILTGVDGSELSDSVLDYAIWLSKKSSAPLKLLHTIEHSHHSEQVGHEGNLTPNIKEHLLDELSDEERLESKKLIADGKQIIKGAKDKAEAAGVTDLIAKQRHGSLPEALLDLQSQLSMVVLGSKGHDHEGQLHGLGAQLEDAIRVIKKPIFIAKSGFKTPEKVMFAYNGSPTSHKALNLLASMALFKQDLEIHVVSVQKNLSDAQNLIEDAQSVLNDAGIDMIGQAMTGEAVEVITHYQTTHGIDITVMGAFSHGKLHGFFFGSFTTQMLIESNTQFILVR